jgi:hypothetical protein
MDKEEFHWLFGVVQGWFSAKLGSKISDGSQLCQHNFHCPQQPQGNNKQESTTFILPYGSNKQQCMDKEEFHWLFGVHWGWFWAKLGSKSVMDPSCQHNFFGHQQPRGHNKQESTTFILPYGSNKQQCMDKEEFHWLFGVVQGWFSAKLGSKISDDPIVSTISFGHQQPRRHYKQESTTFILPYGSNKQHCMDKEEFHWLFGVHWGWFSAKLGSKISDGSQLCQHNFLWPPTSATGT